MCVCVCLCMFVCVFVCVHDTREELYASLTSCAWWLCSILRLCCCRNRFKAGFSKCRGHCSNWASAPTTFLSEGAAAFSVVLCNNSLPGGFSGRNGGFFLSAAHFDVCFTCEAWCGQPSDPEMLVYMESIVPCFIALSQQTNRGRASADRTIQGCLRACVFCSVACIAMHAVNRIPFGCRPSLKRCAPRTISL